MVFQEQFLEVIDRDLAERRFQQALRLEPLGEETVPLETALGRVLAADVRAAVDVPSFDRSNFDGFAVRSADTLGADEEHPRRLKLLPEVIATAVIPQTQISSGEAVSIATGAMLPRGADAVLMVEHADSDGADGVLARRAIAAGFGVAFAGTDIAAGETVLRRGELLTSRETGVLAAIGEAEVGVWKQPNVAILSTGDEIIAPGQPMSPGRIYDSNARILADAVRELGGRPVMLGVVNDDLEELRKKLQEALQSCDVVLLSGGTSKGQGDLSYRAVSELKHPGIVAHGVALKPGKPICLASSHGKPVVILPGFPTSAIFTFHEFVAPVIRRLGGRPAEARDTVSARMAVKVNSEIGRTEYLLVGLAAGVETNETGESKLTAYPMGKGSGSVTTFSRADGFVTIDRQQEILPAAAAVDVQLLGRGLQAADLTVIGSHCLGLDYLLSQLHDRGWKTKFLVVGSTAGLQAAQRGECDLAGIHLLDAESGLYNAPLMTDDLLLLRGYGRMQGVLFRPGDVRFAGKTAEQAIADAAAASDCLMVNRNAGSGTRILLDRYLRGEQPAGYAMQSKSHNAVAAAVAQSRADWGVAIEGVAQQAELGFLPLAQEQYDFAVPKRRAERPALAALRELLAEPRCREELAAMGFELQEGEQLPHANFKTNASG